MQKKDEHTFLVIDIGNTHVVTGWYQEGELIQTWRFRSNRGRTADEFYSLLQPLQMSEGIRDKVPEAVVVSSVVPELTRVFSHMTQKYLRCPFYSINGYTDLGLRYLVSDPGFIGADLIVNAYAAWKKYKSDCIICDMGTATTVQVVTSSGVFMGAIIAPGVTTAASYLFERTAQLSQIEIEAPKVVLGTNTKDALLAGIVTGHAMMMDGFIRRINKEYALTNPTIIATGGIAPLISAEMDEAPIVDRTLTLEGLYSIGCYLA